MKNYIYILSIGLFLTCSCSQSESSLDNNNASNELICNPYVSNAFNSNDFPEFSMDETTIILNHRQKGDCLVLETQFDGGCEDHILQLLIDENSLPAINLGTVFLARLSHNNTDPCDAKVVIDVNVDISRLELLQLDVIQLSIEGYDQVVELVF